MRVTLAVLWLPLAFRVCDAGPSQPPGATAPAEAATEAAAEPEAEDLGYPALKTENVSVARSDIRIWDVKATSAVRQGSTTSNEQGQVKLRGSDGSTSTHDVNYKRTTGTLFQDGEVCHNYGPRCYCGVTTFRFESGAKLWKFGTPKGNKAVQCPSGVKPTGDAEIREPK